MSYNLKGMMLMFNLSNISIKQIGIRIILTASFFLLSAAAAMAANRLIIVAPGETFTAGSGFGGTIQDQIAGLSFDFTLGAVDDTDNYVDTSFGSGQGASVTYTAAPTTAVFNPATSQRLNQTFNGVTYSGWSYIGVTLSPTSSGNCTIQAGVANPTGFNQGSKTVYVHYMDKFVFTLPGSWTAGGVYYVTVTARDDLNNVVTEYNGQVSFSSPNGGVNGGNTGTLDTVTFANGVAYPRIQLYYAASGIYLRAAIVARNPGTVATLDSSTFTVAAAAASRFVVMGPGQSSRLGASSGIGRTPATMTTQTAGVPFSVSVYACDQYWNRVSSSASVNLAATDLGFGGSITGPANLSGGVARFDVDLRRVSAAGQTLTATGGLTSDQDALGLTHGTLSLFGFDGVGPARTAGVPFYITITAYDAWGNTCTTGGAVPSSVGNSVSSGVYFDTTSYTPPSIAASQFNGDGRWAGNFTVYRAGSGIQITSRCGSATGTSSAFTVNVNAANRYVVIMPGETWTPGENHGGWGCSGTGSAVTAGVPFSLSVYVTDLFGNQIGGASGNRTFNLTFDQPDALASPTSGSTTDGLVQINMIMTAYTTQQNITASGSGISYSGSTGQFTVSAATLHHFNVVCAGNTTAGQADPTVITARDYYDNLCNTWTGTIYISAPNLDYSVPTESAIQVEGGSPNYTTYAASATWQDSITANGTLSTNVYFYRATTGTATAYLHVSGTGRTGVSQNLTIYPASWTKMFVLVPGEEYRPGGIDTWGGSFSGDGYEGTPLSQQVGGAFGITVYATDQYWNIIPSRNDSFQAYTSLSSSNLGSYPGTYYSLSSGQRYISVILNEQQTYVISAYAPGSTTYTTPNISAFSVEAFTITGPGGAALPMVWTVGVPVQVSITAFENEICTIRATQFNGTARLETPLNHDSGQRRVITPLNIQFEQGWWGGEVTIYRAKYNGTSHFTVVLGGVEGESGSFNILPSTPKKLLIIETGGMTTLPGVAPEAWPEFADMGAIGQPSVQTAGTPIPKIEFYLCDDYWNQVTNSAYNANTYTITSGDPYPAMLSAGGTTLSSATYQMTNGYLAWSNNLTLFTVGHGSQWLKIERSGLTSFTLGSGVYNEIPVKHAMVSNYPYNYTAFRIQIPAGDRTAGEPFPVTITAIDPYGNTLDSINGATPFEGQKDVSLSIAYGSLWPTNVGSITDHYWNEGVSYPWVYVYKKAVNQYLTAKSNFGQSIGDEQGTSSTFEVVENAYRRLVPVITGMKDPSDLNYGGGFYTGTYPSSPPPEDTTLFNNFGTPFAQQAGTAISYFRVYACDTFGNIVQCTDDVVHLTTTDRFSPLPIDEAVAMANGFANFGDVLGDNFYFHTQGMHTITAADATITTITAGTTPNITVNPGTFFGLQILIPGQVAVEGSGNSNVGTYGGVTITGVQTTGERWYTGVTPEADPDQLETPNVYWGSNVFKGEFFSVTVQAVDAFGNFLGSESGYTVNLDSNDYSIYAVPQNGNVLSGTLANGKTYFNCKLDTDGQMELRPLMSGKVGYPQSYSLTRVTRLDQTNFAILINGHETGNPITVEAAPNTFLVRVEVRYPSTGAVVAGKVNFRLLPLTGMTPDVNGNGTLTLNSITPATAQTEGNGVYEGYGSYSAAEQIYIKVEGDSTYPAADYSVPIIVQASAPSRINLTADTISYNEGGNGLIYQIQANNTARITAEVFDANNNRVSGQAVDMSIINTETTFSRLDDPESTTTDASGIAYRTFYAGAQNLRHIIRAVAGGLTADLTMMVTVTNEGGVYPNPFNPQRGQSAHIDYGLTKDAPVKIYVYTLLGDLVWSKDIPAGAEGGHTGVNSVLWNGNNDNGVQVANGGYIAIVKVDGQEKFRFKIGVYKEQ